jgi:hypothetical protein
MIRAAALSYAIVFSLLTGLICSGVLFIASAQKRIEVLHNNKERIIFDSYAAVQYGVRNLSGTDSAQLLHPNGDTSSVHRGRWGAFTIVTSRTFRGDQKKQRSALTGFAGRGLPALYLSGNLSSLKVTGRTRVEGIAYLPNASVERSHVGGKNYEFPELIFGEKRKAELELPSLRKEWQNVTAADLTRGLAVRKEIPADSTFSFHNSTSCYETIEPLVLGGTLAGNVIIHSFDSILVLATAKLDNVILVAPVVRLQEGFVGRVQVVASERIICEKDVRLLYPSVLLLNELSMKNPLSGRSVILNEGAMVLGGILITTQAFDYRQPPVLGLAVNSTVAGLIYNTGETEAAGNIAGSLYTAQLVSHTGGGTYGNHLVDATVSSKELPADFLLPCWLQEQAADNQKIVKWL